MKAVYAIQNVQIILYRPFLARSPESKVLASFPVGYSFPSFRDALHITASAITEIPEGDGQNMRVLPSKLNTRRLRRIFDNARRNLPRYWRETRVKRKTCVYTCVRKLLS